MTLHQGQTLHSRYRIVRLLGQGGFGAVYRAWDTILERPCALKESLDTSDDAQRQFKREAKILANLAHPNLPRVYDYFTIPVQGQYLVMDYVEGQDLQEMLNQAAGPLSEAQILPWIDQVCDALSYLHSQKQAVIHRDIKPANIKITPQGHAMLVDFGIAKVYDPNLDTTQGARAVTPGFSPYEQYGLGTTDVRSDVYALGATLYFILSGQKPPDSLQRVVRDPLVPVDRINPNLSSRMVSAIERAMQIDPNQRFRSIVEFKRALRGEPAILDVQSQDSLMVTSTVAQPPLRRRGLSVSTILGIVALLSFLGLALVVVVVALVIKPVGLAELLRGSSPATETPIAVLETGASGAFTASPEITLVSPGTPDLVPQSGSTIISLIDGATLIYVPAGEFWMGSTDVEAGPNVDQQPRHRVYLDAYWIDRTEVTNKMYAMCVDEGVCQPPVKAESITRKFYYGNPDYGDYPVIWISWQDASNYCQWAERRLPSEAEWERGARGDDGINVYPWGSRAPDGELANFCDTNCSFDWKDPQVDDSYGDTAPVSSFPGGASLFGLLNMAGNVWEWVQDFYSQDYYSNSPLENPFGPPSGIERVLRGGSFENNALDIRSINRFSFGEDAATSSFGFRCAVEAN